jgi:hypothetical protein
MADIETVGIDGLIFNHSYPDGHFERLIFAGKPAPTSFSVIYQEGQFVDNPQSPAPTDHDPDASTMIVQEQRQIYYPVTTRLFSYQGRKKNVIEVTKVEPERISYVRTTTD